MAFGSGNIAKVKASVRFDDPSAEKLRKNVQLLVFKERQWDNILQHEDQKGNLNVDCMTMSKSAKYKDYMYFVDGDPP